MRCPECKRKMKKVQLIFDLNSSFCDECKLIATKKRARRKLCIAEKKIGKKLAKIKVKEDE